MGEPTSSELDLVDWRRRVTALYAAVRAAPTPPLGHELWRHGRDELFRHHGQSPLLPDDPLRETGVRYWPYDDALRFEVEVTARERDETLEVQTSGDGTIRLRLLGHAEVPPPLGCTLDVWWLDQYGGGVFIPLRDGTAGRGSYGGGRYLLDTAKSADLGSRGSELTLDFNFLYHPSCRYNPRWECPLAPPGNTTSVAVEAGERM